MLRTMKSKSWESSSNTNSCYMVVELETLLASQARIMKYGLIDKFLSIELEANICLKGHTTTMIGFIGASPTSSTRWQMNLR
jgi:hypothetical protein